MQKRNNRIGAVMDKEKRTVGFECPSCKGPLYKKINQDAKFPYRCAQCGLEYLTPPPSSADNSIWRMIEKLLNTKNED